MKISIILNLVIFLSFVKSKVLITGRCANSGIPPKATRYLIPKERNRFDNGQKVEIECENNNNFDIAMNYEITCKNGQWIGKDARCGKRIDSEVKHLKINYCDESGDSPEVSVPIELSKWNSRVSVRNSFDNDRINRNITQITLNGSKCYTYKINFNKNVTIWFLTIDIFTEKTGVEKLPTLTPNVKHRDCTLQSYLIYPDSINPKAFRYQFFCDFKSSYKSINTGIDSIEFKLETNTEEEIGLSAVYISEIYTHIDGTPDCGVIRIKNIGFDSMFDKGSEHLSCNDSFYDINQEKTSISMNVNPKHRFDCDINGVWKGDWPICVPKKPCPNEKVMSEIDSSIIIEEIGNVYFLNESQWFAINDSFIRYKCVDENNLMVGERVRVCLKNGNWNNKVPYCVRTGITSLSIVGILFGILIIFVSIVLILFRINSKGVEKRFRETGDEIQALKESMHLLESKFIK